MYLGGATKNEHICIPGSEAREKGISCLLNLLYGSCGQGTKRTGLQDDTLVAIKDGDHRVRILALGIGSRVFRVRGRKSEGDVTYPVTGQLSGQSQNRYKTR